jgi:hypothetical protein
MKSRPVVSLQYAPMQWTILLAHLLAHLQGPKGKNTPNPLKIYSLDLDQLQTFPTSPFNPNLNSQQERFYLLISHESHTRSITLACSLPPSFSRQLLQIPIDMRACRDYILRRNGYGNGQICLLRSYMCFLAQLYIWSLSLRLVRLSPR